MKLCVISSPKMLRRPLVLVLLGGILLAGLSGCRSSGTGSPSAAPMTTWVSDSYLVSSFATSLAKETTANMTYLTAFDAASSDITELEPKLALDDNTIQAIGLGQGCNAPDASTYPSCVTSEEKTAAYARSDAAAVEAQVQADFQHDASSVSSYQSALGTFVGQMDGLPWPSAYSKYVNTAVTAARTFRRVIFLQYAALASIPQSSVSAINAQTLVDGGKFVDAVSALKGALDNAGK